MHALSAISPHIQEYAQYAVIAGPTVAEYGGEFLTRGGDATQVCIPMGNGQYKLYSSLLTDKSTF